MEVRVKGTEAAALKTLREHSSSGSVMGSTKDISCPRIIIRNVYEEATVFALRQAGVPLSKPQLVRAVQTAMSDDRASTRVVMGVIECQRKVTAVLERLEEGILRDESDPRRTLYSLPEGAFLSDDTGDGPPIRIIGMAVGPGNELAIRVRTPTGRRDFDYRERTEIGDTSGWLFKEIVELPALAAKLGAGDGEPAWCYAGACKRCGHIHIGATGDKNPPSCSRCHGVIVGHATKLPFSSADEIVLDRLRGSMSSMEDIVLPQLRNGLDATG